jgi:hypothetical protein
MCGIVATASHMTPNSPRSPSFPPGSTQAEVLWRDDNFTAYREKANPVSSKGHIIVAFKYALAALRLQPSLMHALQSSCTIDIYSGMLKALSFLFMQIP